jgi:hypothetical protein
MTTPTPPFGAPTPEARVRRAFDSAVRRMSVATTVADLEDELSNMLHHLYRLGELRRWQLSQVPSEQLNRKDFGERLRRGSDDLRAARAAMWVRNDDTHNLASVTASPVPPAAVTGLYGPIYTAMYGVLAWQPLTKTDSAGRDQDYADTLEGRSVLDTMRRAFDAMAALR